MYTICCKFTSVLFIKEVNVTNVHVQVRVHINRWIQTHLYVNHVIIELTLQPRYSYLGSHHDWCIDESHKQCTCTAFKSVTGIRNTCTHVHVHCTR